MTTYTDTQLQQALVKMLPEKLFIARNGLLAWRPEVVPNEHHSDDIQNNLKDTELLQICWEIEETLSEYESFDYSCDIKYHATWQQRTPALCKVKGVEIV